MGMLPTKPDYYTYDGPQGWDLMKELRFELYQFAYFISEYFEEE